MTLLIAMEFKHSIVRVARVGTASIQVKTVILIGLIALARKFVVLDPDTSPAKIAARGQAPHWRLLPLTGCCAIATTASPRNLGMNRHHPSDLPLRVLQTSLAHRLQTGC
jgi:hypothetical protein